MVNIQRFTVVPTVFKPVLVVLIILTMIFAGASSPGKDESFSGSWYVWLTLIVQLIFLIAINVLFALELERLLTCGRDNWPLAELIYSCVLVIVNIINVFVIADWNSDGGGSTSVLAALFAFSLVVINGISGFMMFRIWRGFVQSGAAQNPTANTQPGSIDGMHPGI